VGKRTTMRSSATAMCDTSNKTNPTQRLNANNTTPQRNASQRGGDFASVPISPPRHQRYVCWFRTQAALMIFKGLKQTKIERLW
jgi:hypothetical protein